MLGDAFLVAPILDATGKRDVALPSGARWLDWWAPSQPARDGGTVLTSYDASQGWHIPIFLRQGAIVPMNVSDDVTGMGTSASAGHWTVLVVPPASGQSDFALHEDDDSLTDITVSASAASVEVSLSKASKPTILRVQLEQAPASIAQGTTALPRQADRAQLDAAATGWLWDKAAGAAWVKLPAASGAVGVQIVL